MVGLADIPIVGKFVEKVSECTVDAVFRGLHYMFSYQTLVNNLNSEIEKLNIEKEKMSRKVREEKANGKTIEDYHLPIPNPISRFLIVRNAVKKAEAVTQRINSGKKHLTGGIAYLPEVKKVPKPGTTFKEFQSRKGTYGKLWDAQVNQMLIPECLLWFTISRHLLCYSIPEKIMKLKFTTSSET
ncbi:hypothetical protein ACET3Z_010703 [Daucus carota]